MADFTELTDELWAAIEPLLCQQPGGVGEPDKLRGRGEGPKMVRGRKPRYSRRALVNGVLWVLCTGKSWRSLPGHYPSRTVCHDAFSEWCRSGIMVQIAEVLAEVRPELGRLILDRRGRNLPRAPVMIALPRGEIRSITVHRL